MAAARRIVVAAGRGPAAARVVEEARAAGVPIAVDAGLAGTLAELPPGAENPRGHLRGGRGAAAPERWVAARARGVRCYRDSSDPSTFRHGASAART